MVQDVEFVLDRTVSWMTRLFCYRKQKQRQTVALVNMLILTLALIDSLGPGDY